MVAPGGSAIPGRPVSRAETKITSQPLCSREFRKLYNENLCCTFCRDTSNESVNNISLAKVIINYSMPNIVFKKYVFERIH